MMVNQLSGDPTYDPVADIAAASCPARRSSPCSAAAASTSSWRPRSTAAATRSGRRIKALGVTGGDGSVGAGGRGGGAPRAAAGGGAAGTLNHFARDVGVYDLQEVVDATARRAGGRRGPRGGRGAPRPRRRPRSHEVVRTRTFLNTASIGSYPELVRLREQWQPRWGKWPAFAAALVVVLRRAAAGAGAVPRPVAHGVVPVRRQRPLPPARMVPAWRPTLDSGLLDVRWLRADVRFSRLRVDRRACSSGALGHSRVYGRARGAGAGRGAGRARDARDRRGGGGGSGPLHVPGGRRRGSRCTGATSGSGPGGSGPTSAC